MGGDGPDDGDVRSPLAGVARTVTERSGATARRIDRAWRALAEAADGSADPWDRIPEDEPAAPPTSRGAPSSDPRAAATGTAAPDRSTRPRRGRWFPSYPSGTAAVAHGATTAATLLLGVLIGVGSAIGTIPGRFWVLALPLLAAGVVCLVPVVAWSTRAWNPRELG